MIINSKKEVTEITIEARKFDGTVHRRWNAELVEETPELWKLVGTFDREIKHSQLGVIRRDTISVEYYWKERYFNIFAFYEPAGDFRNFYCNINLPPTLENGVLSYVDLDIDVLVRKDWSFEILDMDEFEENTDIYNYPSGIIKKAQSALRSLLMMIEKKEFPFNLPPAITLSE